MLTFHFFGLLIAKLSVLCGALSAVSFNSFFFRHVSSSSSLFSFADLRSSPFLRGVARFLRFCTRISFLLLVPAYCLLLATYAAAFFLPLR